MKPIKKERDPVISELIDTPPEEFSEQQVDNLLDIVYNRGLTDVEKDIVLQAVLPNNEAHRKFLARLDGNAIINNKFCQLYGNYRALGLTQKDAARLCGITYARLLCFLSGAGLSKSKHMLLLEAEQKSIARFKYNNFKLLHEAAEEGQWRAAVALLEKVLPEEYGPRMDVRSTGSLKLGTVECADMAQKAASDLQALRERRKSEQKQEFKG